MVSARGSAALLIAPAFALAFALASCKSCTRAPNKKSDGATTTPPSITLHRLEALSSTVLAAAEPKPTFSALACDGRSIHAVSRLGVAFTDRVNGRDHPIKNPALDILPDKPLLTAIATVGPKSIVAVGERGVIVRWDENAKWKLDVSPVTTNLQGVVEVWDWVVAVGAGGTIVGQRSAEPKSPWKRIESPTQEDLFAVSSCTADIKQPKVCAVGGHGTLLVGDVTQTGVVFRAIATGTTHTLRAVTPGWLDSGPAHAVGDEGTIVVIDTSNNNGGGGGGGGGAADGGVDVRVVPSGTTQDLLGVADSEIARSKLEGSFLAVVAVGKHGIVLVQATGRDKVRPFEKLRVSTTDDFLAIVPDREMQFIVAPRAGGLRVLELGVDARHPLPE